MVPERRGKGLNHASDEATNGGCDGRAVEVAGSGLTQPLKDEGKATPCRLCCGCSVSRGLPPVVENLVIVPWKALNAGL